MAALQHYLQTAYSDLLSVTAAFGSVLLPGRPDSPDSRGEAQLVQQAAVPSCVEAGTGPGLSLKTSRMHDLHAGIAFPATITWSMGMVSVGIGKDDWWRRWMELTRFSTQDEPVLGFQNSKPITASQSPLMQNSTCHAKRNIRTRAMLMPVLVPQAELEEAYQKALVTKANATSLGEDKDVDQIVADVLVGPNWLWMRDRVPLCNPMLLLATDAPVAKDK